MTIIPDTKYQTTMKYVAVQRKLTKSL